jgi:DNA-binding NarL/FixJ family response regulator
MLNVKSMLAAEACPSDTETVLVLLGSAFIAEGLSQFLESHGYRCCAEEGLVAPDAIIVDASTIDDDLRSRYPHARIFFLQMGEDPAWVAALLSWHRVHAIIPPTSGFRGFEKTLKAIAPRRSRRRPKACAAAGAGVPAPLSRQERRVIACVCRGDTNGQIAQALNVSTHTVKAHVHSILKKTGAANRARLVTLLSSCCTGGEDHGKQSP